MGWALVLTTHNNVRYTALAVESFRRHWPDVPIIVVDNRSSDETETWTRRQEKLRRGVYFVPYDGERNLAHSWNLGVARARGLGAGRVVVSNNDVVFTRGLLEELGAALDDGQVGVAIPAENSFAARDIGLAPARELVAAAAQFVGCSEAFDPRAVRSSEVLINELDRWWGQAPTPKRTTEYVTDPYYKSGGFCFAIDLNWHAVVGDFDSHTFHYFGEDWDYFARALHHCKVARRNTAFVWHFGERSSGKLGWSERFDALMASRFRLITKHENHKHLVSVVVPVYNRPQELDRALRSVLAQTCQDFRIYVIDDASTCANDILGVCRGLGDARIGRWLLEQNGGPSVARNVGVRLAEGKYIALLDADDEWLAPHLATHLHEHERDDLQMTYSDARFAWRWREGEGFITLPDRPQTVPYFGPFDRERLQRENYIITSSTVWWARTLKGLRFDEDMRYCEDWKLFRECPDPVKHVSQETLRYYLHPDEPSLMTQYSDVARKAPPRPDLLLHDGGVRLRAARFTVVIPTVDRPELLRRAVASCGPNCEVVVVDDGSEDVREVVQVLREAPNVRVYRSVGEGPSAARNLGTEVTRTPWVKFLDDDDVLVLGWLKEHELYTASSDVISCHLALHGSDGIEYYADEDVYTSQLAFRVSSLRSLGGFNEVIRVAEERELMERAAEAGLRRAHIGEPCVMRGKSSLPRDYMRRESRRDRELLRGTKIVRSSG